MIDESQLLFMQAASETSKQTEDVQITWEILSSIIKSTKYVRCYDGFLGTTTSDVLTCLGILDAAILRMPTSIPNTDRTMIIQSVNHGFETKEWLKAWAADIGARVADGKNVMVFYPFKYEKAMWPSMTQMMALICDEGSIDISDTVMHYGGMDNAEKKRILSNINEIWKVRVDITNSAVTAGVDSASPIGSIGCTRASRDSETLGRSSSGSPAPATSRRTRYTSSRSAPCSSPRLRQIASTAVTIPSTTSSPTSTRS